MLLAEARDVALRKRHDLRPRRRAGGVQHQRDVVRLGRARRAALPPIASPARRNCPAGASASRLEPQDRHAELRRDRLGRRVAAGVEHQRLGAKVGQVELELVGAVGRD